MRLLEITESVVPKGAQPEKLKLLVEFVPEDSEGWGILESMRGTSWEGGIQEVSPDLLSHALHGRMGPLLKELGRPPAHSAKRVSEEEGLCSLHGCCIKSDAKFCRPGSEIGRGWRKVLGPPECYQPPVETEDQEVFEAFVQVSKAWKEGTYVLVVKEGGFNLS
jgi:hypothetical protein